MSILRSFFPTFRFAVWGTLFLLPISLVAADAPGAHSNGQPRLPFLRRYAKPAPAGTEVERAPASVARKRPAPTVRSAEKSKNAKTAKNAKHAKKAVDPRAGARRAQAARPAPAPGGRKPAGRSKLPFLNRGRATENRGRVAAPAHGRGGPSRAPSGRSVPARRASSATAPTRTAPAAPPPQSNRPPITREPAQAAPAAPPAPPPPYAASPKSAPAAPVKNIQLRDPNDKSDGPRSIKLDMTRPYLR